MAITHSVAIRNSIADLVVDAIDAGAGDLNGDLVVMTSGDVEVSTLAFSDPAFGSASTGTADANAIADQTNSTGGTAALFKVQDKANTEVFRGSVTATGGGGDMQVSSTNIGNGDTLSVTAMTYTAPV